MIDHILRSGKPLLDVCQRIGLFDSFSGPLASTPEQSAYIAWCILIDNLADQQHPYLEHATTHLYRHYFFGLFPKKPSEKADDLASIKKRVTSLLKKQWGIDAALKESFSVNSECVDFALKLKTQGQSWITLYQEQGARLKPTRLSAYKYLLQRLQDGQCSPAHYPANELLPVVRKKKKLIIKLS